MDMHQAFLRDILAHPDDESRRLIYADWLEEQAGPQDLARAALLRLQVQRARLAEDDARRGAVEARWHEVRGSIDTDWLAFLAEVPIEACLRWRLRCPEQWTKLQLTTEARVRHCTSCRKEVYYCTSLTEARNHAQRGHCIAVDAGVEREPGDLEPPTECMTLGIIDPDWHARNRRK
jgi:uncharacterized protein (TIGR02996 family)